MEPTYLPAAKRLRMVKNVKNQPVTECVREFTLHQQFPSMVTVARNKIGQLSTKDEVNSSTDAGVAEIAKHVPSKDVQAMNKIQKLRIKSKNGRDLGEFSVQFLPQKDSIVNAKLIRNANAEVAIKLNPPTALTAAPSVKPSKIPSDLPVLQKSSINLNSVIVPITVISPNQSIPVISINKPEVRAKINTGHKPLILSKRKISIENVESSTRTEGRNNVPKEVVRIRRIPINNLIERRKPKMVQISNISKHMQLQPEQEALLKSKKNSCNLEPNKQCDLKIPNVSLNGEILELHNKIASSDINEAPVKIVQNKKTLESNCPLGQCGNVPQLTTKTFTYIKNLLTPELQVVDQYQKKTENIPPVANNSSVRIEKDPGNSHIYQVKKKLKTKDTKLICSRQKVSAEIRNVSTATTNVSGIIQKPSDCLEKSNQPVQEKLGENITPTVLNSSVTPLNTNIVLNENQEKIKDKNSMSCPVLNEKPLPNSQTNSTDNEISSDKTAPFVQQSDSITSTTSSSTSEDVSTNLTTSSDIPTDTSVKDKLSEQFNIIKQAMSSVKDEELRAKALKALADCGIGIERNIPVPPPEQLKPVNDSQIQTEVFSLLEPESFVLVRQDLPALERINQVQRVSLHPPLSNSTPVTRIRQTQNNLINNEIAFVDPNVVYPMSNNQDLDDFFNALCIENVGANKVKEVLTVPNPLISRISMQLRKDFNELKNWDENGMLNIHRAIASNNVNAVQRLLMVLKACKENVEVCTDDGTSCLELAIKVDASAKIVKLLLDAGAEPVLSKLAHDHALLIASKHSSPLIPMLVSYAKGPTLLDRTDSLGFTALHYCALNGNLEGANALIEAGANVNVTDNRSGRTAFFHALENEYLTVAQSLINAGAIANIPNFAGQTVLALMDDVKNLSLRATLSKLLQ